MIRDNQLRHNHLSVGDFDDHYLDDGVRHHSSFGEVSHGARGRRHPVHHHGVHAHPRRPIHNRMH
jgi:hypothetical protein